ncbi:MAG TPA: hypothetical protein VF170_01240 [Planctomycetaceae bacterium]
MTARPVIVLVVGLEASGKSRLGDELCGGRPAWRRYSDFLTERYNRPLRESEKFGPFADWIGRGHNAVLDEVSWCDPQRREEAERELSVIAPAHRLEVIFFENDPAACVANAHRRRHGDPDGLRHDLTWIAARTKSYVIPDPLPPHALVRPVWRP